MKTPFDKDGALVQGSVDIADSLVPPPDYGIFGIRWPYRSLEAKAKLESVRLILWSCMDCRVLRPLYERVQTWGYQADEILILSMAGGPLQIPPERIEIIQNLFAQLAQRVPNLQKLWMVPHTRTCGGLKHFCQGRTGAEALKPVFLAQAVARGVDPELYAAQLALPSVCRLLPDAWRPFAECAVAEPVEATRSVKLYSQWFATDDAKQAADVYVSG